MKYQAFTNDSLAMMHHGARGALVVDDELTKLGAEPRFRVRETPGWKEHVADLEGEMVKREMVFDPIDLAQNQNIAPVADISPAPNPELSKSPNDTHGLLKTRIAAIIKKTIATPRSPQSDA
jgi:hypothetical protein